MPRPTVAQLLYGSATVVCSTLAMLLLSETDSGPGVPVIAVSALILGVFVAFSVPRRGPAPTAAPKAARRAERMPTRHIAAPARTSEPAVREREPAGP
ncbi:hypothetical protein ACIRF8_02890 [Streptomyces sp. NPDC102406]|uniref:hypothetical protein n=1 Tax=Streptomyces sp. NPDC102406 TaxID=3366171 RepID=UPI00381F0B4C